MADTKISALTAASALGGTEPIPLVQGGTTKRTTPNSFLVGDLSGTYPNPVVSKINGTSLAGLATGVLKNTTGTGVPSVLALGTASQQIRVNAGATDIEFFTPTANPMTTTGDLIQSSDNSGTPSRIAAIATGNALISGGVGTISSWGKIGLTTHISGTLPVANGGTGLSSFAVGDLIYASGSTTLVALADIAAGSYLRSGGVTTAPLWSTLILPNAATANRIAYATSTNTYGESANLTFNGTTLTTTALTFSNTAINTTAGDAATINGTAGRFRKDTSGTTFTLTNSFITANSIILLTFASDLTATGNVVTVVAGSGSAVITFWTAGVGAAAPASNMDVNFLVIN